MTLLLLFYEFFKTGLFAIGGGLATLPFLYDIAEKYQWFNKDVIPNMIAISESTPGPIGINMATYAGFSSAGILGAIVSTLGIIAPAIIIATLIFNFLDKYSTSIYVKRAFYGIRPASVGLITTAGISILTISVLDTKLFKATGNIYNLFNEKGIIFLAVLLLCTNLFKRVHPVVFIFAAAALGIIFKF